MPTFGVFGLSKPKMTVFHRQNKRVGLIHEASESAPFFYHDKRRKATMRFSLCGNAKKFFSFFTLFIRKQKKKSITTKPMEKRIGFVFALLIVNFARKGEFTLKIR